MIAYSLSRLYLETTCRKKSIPYCVIKKVNRSNSFFSTPIPNPVLTGPVFRTQEMSIIAIKEGDICRPEELALEPFIIRYKTEGKQIAGRRRKYCVDTKLKIMVFNNTNVIQFLSYTFLNEDLEKDSEKRAPLVFLPYSWKELEINLKIRRNQNMDDVGRPLCSARYFLTLLTMLHEWDSTSLNNIAITINVELVEESTTKFNVTLRPSIDWLAPSYRKFEPITMNNIYPDPQLYHGNISL